MIAPRAEPTGMRRTADILILGGGTIALSTAIAMQLAGAKVTVLSRNFSQAACQAAAGMLAPQAEALPPGPLLELCLRSRSLYPEWIRKLETLTGLNPEFWPCGILAPAYAEDLATGRISPDHPSEFGSRWLEAAEISQQQPGLSAAVVGGWWFPKDAQVDNRALAKTLWAAAQALGIEVEEGVAVTQIRGQQERVTEVATTNGDWQAQWYVLATGAWSGELLPIPVVPRKGQMLSLRVPPGHQVPQPLQQVLFGNQIYLVPRRDGRILLGATNEAVGFTPANTPRGIQTLLQGAIRLYPALQDWPIEEFWWGFRPATPDQAPILGFGPYQNLVLATGHYRNGILLAPITAALITDLVLHQVQDPLLSAFHWQRFHQNGDD